MQINEFSALVGTYRILLLRAHRRLCGPSAGEEMRKLRVLTERALGKLRDVDNESPTTWSCSMCELNQANGQAGSGRARVSPALKHSWSDGQIMADQSRSEQQSRVEELNRWMNATFSAAPSDRTKADRTIRRPSAKAGTQKSKFCVIL